MYNKSQTFAEVQVMFKKFSQICFAQCKISKKLAQYYAGPRVLIPESTLNADPDPTFHIKADTDPAPAPRQNYANLRPHASIVSIHGLPCGSMRNPGSVADPWLTFWGGSGSGSADPCIWLMAPDPDSDPDPGSGSCYFRHWPSRCQQKTNFLTQFVLLITFWSYIYIIFQR